MLAGRGRGLHSRNLKGNPMGDDHHDHGDHENPILKDLPEGSFAFHYTLQAKPGRAQDFVDAFEAWDHSDENIVHTTPGIVHEGVLYQSEDDPERFYPHRDLEQPGEPPQRRGPADRDASGLDGHAHRRHRAGVLPDHRLKTARPDKEDPSCCRTSISIRSSRWNGDGCC